MPLTARPKRPVHHKKLQAQHHRKSKRYIKPYLPYLPLLLIVGAGLLFNSFWQGPQVLGGSADFSPDALLMFTNQERVDNTEPALQLDPQLAAAANAKAQDLVSKNYWAHTSPDGIDFSSFVSASGYQFQSMGENLAYGFHNAGQVIVGWMNSPEHRQNLLSDSYQAVGFGVASSPNYLGKGPAVVVVAEYAQPVPAAANITFKVNNPVTTPEVKGVHTEFASRSVARIQLLTEGQAAWSMIAVSALGGAALMFFFIRHGLRIHRMLSRGEEFIVHHPWVDVLFVALATAGYVLSRTSGFVR